MSFHGTNRSLKSSWRIYKSWQNRRADPNNGMKMDGLYPADLKRGSLFQVRCFSQRQAFDPPATYAQVLLIKYEGINDIKNHRI